MKHKIFLISLWVSLLLCACSSAGFSVGDRETEASDDYSIDETESIGETMEADKASSEVIPASSEEELSSYIPELIESAAELDANSSLTDFDRMIKEVSTFDTTEFVKDHSYALDHFTGRMFEYDKLFIKYDRKFFDGHWLYGNYVLHLTHYIAEPQDSGIFIESESDISASAFISRVPICHFDKNGEYIPLEKEVTRAEIDKEFYPYTWMDMDLDSLSETADMHEDLFEDREEYHDDSFIEEFKNTFP